MAGNSKATGGETSHHGAAATSHEVGVVLVTSLHAAVEDPVESLSPEVGVLHRVDEGGLPHVATSHQGAEGTSHQEVVGTLHQGVAETSHQEVVETSHQGAAETSHRGAVEILHPAGGATSTLREEVAMREDHPWLVDHQCEAGLP